MGEPAHRGTLVCVVLKAKNLPNKKSIGKQDPYCTLQLGTNSQKTKPDKRGGQHPQWDEQLHFEIYDDTEDQLRSTANGSGSISASNTIETQKRKQSKASKTLRVACYADDAKDPEFIGEGQVDLGDTLLSGEFDEWVTIKAKDRYAGEVYLELTFYSSAAPPKTKKFSKTIVPNGTTYGGAGTYSEEIDEGNFLPRLATKEASHAAIPSLMRPGHASRSSNINNSGISVSVSQSQLGYAPPTESIPPSLRPSSSMAQLDSYTPSYAPPNIQREKSPAPSDFVTQRRESFPVLDHSASMQFHGHRLSDAVPASAIVPQHLPDQSRHIQPLPSSVSYQHPVHANSIPTMRGSQYEGYDAAIDDLNRPISSMSMGARSSIAELPPPPVDIQHYQYAAVPHTGYQAHQGYIAPALHNASIDQFGRPVMAPAPHSYSAIPTSTHSTTNQFSAPTPPPPPTSAPPPLMYDHSQWAGSSSTLPPSSSIPHHGAQHSGASNLIAPLAPAQRPSSPGMGPVPNRPLTAGSYHALPQPPPPQQQQQQQHEYANYQKQPAEYGSLQHNSYGAAAPLPRPLPSTSPMPGGATIPPSPSYGGHPSAAAAAAAAATVSNVNYYPPPPQTPSHYVSPPPLMQWSSVQQAPPLSNSSFSSYPPPPPGPGNEGYVHAVSQSTSPSHHPGQYPPPPPVHQLEYSQQYYNHPPPPLPPHQQQQQQQPPVATMHHLSHPPTSAQSYYPSQQQPPY
ncbi:hypothetical protein CBS101457_006163 [Exobasidium rhododendri]|nr:hypothetical protein CBS101457_006163 [Exobasidium rhododendri]